MRSDDINAYIKEATGDDFSAKDFRTWNATVLAAVALSVSGEVAGSATGRKRAIARAVKEVAHYLGNTPAVCRASYIDPRVFDAYRGGLSSAARCEEAAEVEPGELPIHQRAIEEAVLDLINERERSPALETRRGLSRRYVSSGCGSGGSSGGGASGGTAGVAGASRSGVGAAGVTGSSGTIGWSGVTGVDGTSTALSLPFPYAYRRSSDERMIRETCICEQPTCSAISDCSRSSLEAQAQDLARALVEDPGHPLERDAGLDAVELGVVGADQVAGAGRVALLLAHRGVERANRAALGGLQRLDDLLRRAVDVPGEVGDGRGPAELAPTASRAPPRPSGRAPGGRVPAARPTSRRGSSGGSRRGSSVPRSSRTRARGPGPSGRRP